MTINTTHYKTLLEKELTLVEGELKSIGRINPSNPNDWEAVPEALDIDSADENLVADSIESYEGNTAVLKQLEIRYNEIKNALALIAKGGYGVCATCKAEIEHERLDANPAASTCKQHMN